VLPLMPAFLARHPAVQLDCLFENRQVDLIAEGFDAAIGGGIELNPGVVARELAPAHLVLVAAPSYLHGRKLPRHPNELSDWDGVLMRSNRSGRVRQGMLSDGREQAVLDVRPRMLLNDPQAIGDSARLGMGIALLALPDVLPLLESGVLVRVLPGWHMDVGPISLYFASSRLVPAKTRAFIDYVTGEFERLGWAKRFDARG
jgi:DNA-binding transcriptional LysR family regulator